MRAVIQRVSSASVSIGGGVKSAIGPGFLILLGIEEADTRDDADWLCKKISGLRVFNDENGVMNRSILDTGGEALVVSQFTLMASYKKGNRPSYIRAAGHAHAIPLYEYFVKTKQWIICKFDVDTKPVAIYHNSGKLYKLMGTVDTIENALRDMKLYERR